MRFLEVKREFKILRNPLAETELIFGVLELQGIALVYCYLFCALLDWFGIGNICS